jgi:ribosomal protein S18 acetylase RimI-like enzyme
MIRSFQPGDHAAIAEIFTRAVHEIASEVYSKEQCLAWSDREPNPAHWKRRCELKRPFVFLVDTEIAGFLELDPDGHIDCAYVHPKFQRRGVASALVRHAIDACLASGLERAYVEASLCAKPMFERLGFKVLEATIVNIRGVELANYRMELTAIGMRNPASAD